MSNAVRTKYYEIKKRFVELSKEEQESAKNLFKSVEAIADLSDEEETSEATEWIDKETRKITKEKPKYSNRKNGYDLKFSDLVSKFMSVVEKSYNIPNYSLYPEKNWDKIEMKETVSIPFNEYVRMLVENKE